METKDNSILSVRDLQIEYVTDQEAVKAVNGVSFDLRKGETLGLVGETGAGKTTIAKAIMRILPDPPAKVQGGEIIMDDVDLLRISEKEMRAYRGKRISMIFQDPYSSLNPRMTIEKTVQEPLKVSKKLGGIELSKETDRLMERWGLTGECARHIPRHGRTMSRWHISIFHLMGLTRAGRPASKSNTT